MKTDILADLNESQRQAVVYNAGPQLVIAGAGSGKTRVLTYKIAYLLQNGVKPWNILALTFTNKAAREMKDRIATLVGSATARYLNMGTFHSIFARILRAEANTLGFNSNFTIYDETDSRSLIKRITKDLGLDDKKYKPSSVHSVISMAKNCLITAAMYSADESALARDRDMQMPMIYKIYQSYQERCKQANAMDFDDLLLLTYQLFNDHEDIRRKYADRFQFVLVDEYQDTNNAQQKIVYQLTAESQRVCAVGDDSQSIYSFRGANIDNILSFQDIYNNVKLFKLEQNYRSTQLIVEAANSLIKHNVRQIPKDVYSHEGRGEKLLYKPTYSDKEEAAVVCSDIMRIKRKDRCRYSDFAILYRTNAQSRPFEEQMRKQDIPYKIYGGLSFYQRKEIKDVLAYFRLVNNPDDEEAFVRIVNYPARGIGNATVGKLQQAAAQGGVSLWSVVCNPERYYLGLGKAALTKLEAFRTMICSFFAMAATDDVYQFGKSLIEQSGIKRDLQQGNDPDDVARRENIDDFLGSLNDFVDIQRAEGNENEVHLADYLPTVSLLTDADTDNGSDDVVSLMTIHSAKGLEFQTVFVVGMEDNIFPSPMSASTPRGLEEERRLLYVAITRARTHCILTSAQSRFRYGKTEFETPSRFLRDIDPSLMTVEGAKGMNGGGQSFHPQPRFRSQDSIFGSRPVSQNSGKKLVRVPQSSPSSTSTSGPAASRPSSLPAGLAVGATIVHNIFGEGTVESIVGSGLDTKIKVKFRSGDNKTLLLKYAKITVVK